MMTVTLPTWAWTVGVMALLMGAKLIQEGGKNWGMGKPWQTFTFIGSLLMSVPLMVLLMAIVIQASGGTP